MHFKKWSIFLNYISDKRSMQFSNMVHLSTLYLNYKILVTPDIKLGCSLQTFWPFCIFRLCVRVRVCMRACIYIYVHAWNLVHAHIDYHEGEDWPCMSRCQLPAVVGVVLFATSSVLRQNHVTLMMFCMSVIFNTGISVLVLFSNVTTDLRRSCTAWREFSSYKAVSMTII